MNWGFAALCLAIGIDLGVHAVKHGQPKGDYNLGERIFDAAITLFLVLWAMRWNI